MRLLNSFAAAFIGAAMVTVSAPLDAQTAYVPINRRGAPIYDAANSPRECVGIPIPTLKSRAAQVFEATVSSVKPLEHREFVATLDVHRVWKGDTPSATTVHFSISSTTGPVKVGQRYIFFTQPLTPAQRKAQGLPGDHQERANWVPPCTGPIPPDESLVKELGRSRPPE